MKIKHEVVGIVAIESCHLQHLYRGTSLFKKSLLSLKTSFVFEKWSVISRFFCPIHSGQGWSNCNHNKDE